MSTSTGLRRRRVQLLAGACVGAVATLAGAASPALAADGVTVPLEPSQVLLAAVPIENFGPMADLADLSFDPYESPGPVLVPVQYGGTITVTVPDGLDASGVGAELVFDDNEDGIPEATYSSRFAPANPNRLDVVASAGSVTVTLPADDPIAGDVALLSLSPVTSTLGPAFEDVYDGIDYELGFDAGADPAQTVAPVLSATSKIPCDFLSFESCPLPTPATPGSTITLSLPQTSVLRELGLSDLEGVQVALARMDEEGYASESYAAMGVGISASDPFVAIDVEVTGSEARFVLPADSEPGSYALFVVQETPSGGVSTVFAELTVQAPAAVAPPTEPTEPTEPTGPTVNAGLRSNTGVHLPEAGTSGGLDGSAVATGAGILLLAGAVAAARGRRRPAVEGGSCEV